MSLLNSRIQHLDLAPLYRNFVGFDELASRLEDISGATSDSYPPFNLIQKDEDHFRIELAIAGFGENDIEITAKDRLLTVSGSKDDKSGANQDGYLHRGIAARSFERTFHLADNIEIVGANIADGMLIIQLERIVPEELKPRRIPIGDSKKLAKPNGKSK